MKRPFRITRDVDFKRVRQTGKSWTHPLIVVSFIKNQEQLSRVGIVCAKGYGSAVERNLIKRRLRAIFDDILPFITQGIDVVIIARQPAKLASFGEIHAAVSGLLEKARIIESNASGT